MFKSIYSVRLNDTLSNAAAPQSVDISDVRFWNIPADVPVASTWVFTAEDGATFEIVEATAVGGVLTITKRGLDSSDTEVEVPANRRERRPGTLIYLTAAAFDLIDAQGDNQLNNAILNFTSTTVAQLGIQVVTTAQRDLLSDVIEGKLIENSDLAALQVYIGGAWQTLGISTPTPNASTTVVGKVRIATSLAVPDITAGAYNVVIPSQVQGASDFSYGLKTAFVSKGGNDSTGVVGNPLKTYLTIQAAIAALANVAGSGVFVYPGVYTENLTLKSGVPVMCMPGVSIVGSLTTGGAGNDYRVLGYADITDSGVGLTINMADAADTLVLECQSITVTGGSATDAIFLRNGVSIFVRGDISLDNNGNGIVCGDGTDIDGTITVQGNISQSNATTDNLLFVDGGNTQQLDIYAAALIQTQGIPLLTNAGRVNTYIGAITGDTNGVLSPASGTYTRINGSVISGTTSAIEIANNNVICNNCVLLGANAVTTSGAAQDIRLYNCVSTNAVDGNTTNLITGGLITDADVI